MVGGGLRILLQFEGDFLVNQYAETWENIFRDILSKIHSTSIYDMMWFLSSSPVELCSENPNLRKELFNHGEARIVRIRNT